MGKEVKEVNVAPEGSLAPEGTAAPEAEVKVTAVMSDLAMLRTEALHKGRSADGTGIMGKFKERLINVLEAAKTEAGDAEVAPLPCGAVVRFFLKNTDVFNTLPKDDRYNRAYRYLAQAKKAVNRIGWDIDKLGKENFLIYTGKIS
jgi:hypothetical protein